jgi:hypothetical protein
MAGVASMKAKAAAGGTPRAVSRPAIGTAPHSEPGRATPASPAAGTATSGRLGSVRASHPGGTRALMAPLSTTPSTRKGRAWTPMDTKIVVQVPRAGAVQQRRQRPPQVERDHEGQPQPAPGRQGYPFGRLFPPVDVRPVLVVVGQRARHNAGMLPRRGDTGGELSCWGRISGAAQVAHDGSGVVADHLEVGVTIRAGRTQRVPVQRVLALYDLDPGLAGDRLGRPGRQ